MTCSIVAIYDVDLRCLTLAEIMHDILKSLRFLTDFCDFPATEITKINQFHGKDTFALKAVKFMK